MWAMRAEGAFLAGYHAFFSTKGYLAAYGDVKAAGINPLTHYDQFGWKEGRDPSPQFLSWGEQEGRHAVNDGHFG